MKVNGGTRWLFAAAAWWGALAGGLGLFWNATAAAGTASLEYTEGTIIADRIYFSFQNVPAVVKKPAGAGTNAIYAGLVLASPFYRERLFLLLNIPAAPPAAPPGVSPAPSTPEMGPPPRP